MLAFWRPAFWIDAEVVVSSTTLLFQGLLRGVLHARPKVRSSGRGPVAFPSLLLRLITGICGSVRRSHRPTGARLA